MKLLFGKKWFSWTRLACLLVTGIFLFYVFRTIDFSGFVTSMQHMHWGWLAAALLAYGAALEMGALRWHLALHTTGHAVHPIASSRLFLIGHFFFTVLFGVAGGDLAKSAVYARWFRFSLPEVVAAAPLDRGVAMAGTLLLMGATLLLALGNGGFTHLKQLDFHLPRLELLGVILLLAAAGIGLLFWKPRGQSSWARSIRAFRSGGARLLRSPRVVLPGLGLGILGQVALSGVMALNLYAVTQQNLPWLEMAWAFPMITTIASVPFTFGGAGVRELAAVTLLGLYGVPAADCVAAALLTFFCKITWAGAGGLALWREEKKQRVGSKRALPQTITAVIPVLNEAESLPETLRRLRAVPEVTEILVVDGGSRDATCAVAEAHGAKVLSSAPGRGVQLRSGAEAAQGDVVLLLHADTWIPAGAGRAALHALRDQAVVGGGFWKVFREPHWLLFGSRFKCAVRLLVYRRIAGDQGLFVRREVLEAIGGVPAVPLMEEFELCKRLRKVGRITLADATLRTSARRFHQRGILRTYLRMWWVMTLYRFGTSPAKLRAIYERP